VVSQGIVPRPALLGRLDSPARVTMVSAPAGSGKTVLLQSWIAVAGRAECAAWVPVQREERDEQRFWLQVASALRGTVPGAALVRRVTAAPDLDGWTIAERLLADLASLRDQLWLVIDDLHELPSDQALRQLELVIQRAPPTLRFVLSARQEPRLGLHRLRLAGEVAEVRADDLRFTLAESRALFDAAGVRLPDPALSLLHQRTEGWAAGLRLAALSLDADVDPEKFASEFSGSERTVAEYLLAEVLDRQDEQVRRLLLRTSVLARVNGELADLLTGDCGGERTLQDLEAANAFVTALDARRSWFRYHHLFADLLQLELRRTEPAAAAGLHRAAAGWHAAHGFPVEAVRHAQAAGDWGLAAQLLADHWPGLLLGGRGATVHALLAAFPAGAPAADAELATVAAAGQLASGSLAAAERYIRLAEHGSASVPAGRREQWQVLLGVVRLLLAGQRRDLAAVAGEARRLQAMAEVPDAVQPALAEDLRGLALISLGTAELRAARFDEAARHLEQGVALAHRAGRPFLEFTGFAYLAAMESWRSFERAAQRGGQAIELAERHGWAEEPSAGIAYTMLASVRSWQGQPGEAEAWMQRAERAVRPEAEPAAAIGIRYTRGVLELVRGRDAEAAAAFSGVEQLAGQLAEPHLLAPAARALTVHALVRMGQAEQAEQALAGLSEQDRDRGEMRIAAAALRLAQQDPQAAAAALAPVLDGSAPPVWRVWLAHAYLLEAIARDALGDPGAAGRALERALDLAEPDGAASVFVLHPAPGLLQRHAARGTAHAALLAAAWALLAGNQPEPPPAGDRPLLEPLTRTELRVLRYLPTNLSMPEIAGELYVSHNTIRAHMRHLYAKLGAHRRSEAVERARALGLLAPAARAS
jgi:LuxR family maltose regulon positive regulatory protein